MPDVTLSSDMDAFLTTANDAAARTELGVAIGTNVQAYNANLTAWAGLTPYVLSLAADLSSPSTSYVTSTENVILPAGTYEFRSSMVTRTNSSTAGVVSNMHPSNTSVDETTGSTVTGMTTAEGNPVSSNIQSRAQSNVFQFVNYCNSTASASIRFSSSIGAGIVIFSSGVTINARVAQSSTTDGSNPALLKKGSYIIFTRIA